MSGLARQLRWLIGIRLLAALSAVAPFLLLALLPGQPVQPLPVTPGIAAPGTVHPEGRAAVPDTAHPPIPSPDPWFLLGLLGAVSLASGGYYLLLEKLPRYYEAQAYLQFSGDLALITILLWSLGISVSNPFSLLYLLVIASASALLGRRAGFTVGIVAYCLYAFLVLAPLLGWVSPPARGELVDQAGVFELAYNLGTHLFAFVTIALLTYHLARRLERTERALEEEREDLAELQVAHRDIVESIQSGLMTTDLEGTITSINRTGAGILDSTPETLLGKRTYDTELFDRDRWETLARRKDLEQRRRLEVEVQRKGGSIFIGYSVSPLTNAERHRCGYIVIFQDFTRWHELEEELRIKDRMAAVGELAAGLAHEIGNPLAAISGSVQMLSASFDESHEKRKLMDILLKESQRLDRIIKGFLRFARPKDRSIVRFDIAALLSENFELLRNSAEVAATHTLEIDVQPRSQEITADPDQISQIFWNLARNSLKAMPDGGVLRIAGRLQGDCYRVEVSDTGTGMTIEQRANLFHPFQSFFDSGTGIGMAIVYRIVEDHGGRMAVASRSGEGTRITVELPLAGSPATAKPALAMEGA